MPRFHCDLPLVCGAVLALPSGAARHAQVLRLQPGDPLTLFDGRGGEYAAAIERMERSAVVVRVGAHTPLERETVCAVHLAVGMPANERMDWLVEKATELGVMSIQPLLTSRSVLRLTDERAQKKQAHWEAIAIAACEQCGRNRIPRILAIKPFAHWLATLDGAVPHRRLLLSFSAQARPLPREPGATDALVLSGPEGGLSADEEQQALAAGFAPHTLGPRVLRAETAALAAVARLAES